MVTAADLQQFCSTHDHAFSIKEPFTRGDFTYATSGHILVRVPRLEAVGPVERSPSAEKLFDQSPPVECMPLFLKLPPPKVEECAECSDGESVHDCPNCDCVCDSCDGAGEIEVRVSCEVRGVLFDTAYIRKIQTLPGLKFAVAPPKKAAVRFEFEGGGEGLLMPLSRTYPKHVGANGKIIGDKD